MNNLIRKIPLLYLVAALMLVGCSTISPFSQPAYEQATSLKVESLALMDKAVEPYGNHKKSVAELKLSIEKAYEYAKGRPKNKISTDQWSIIKDPSGNSLGGFLSRWEKNKKLTKGFVDNAKGLVSSGFDTVIELEGGKDKAENDK